MKRLELVKLFILIIFLLVSVVYMRLGKTGSPIWDCIFYVNIYGTLLAQLFLNFKKAWSTDEKVIYLGGCLFCLIILIFNLVITSKTKVEHDLLVNSFTWSNIFCWSVIGIFTIILLFKKFVR